MKIVKETLTDKKFWLCILISLVFFGAFTKLEFATDTYSVFENSGQEMFNHFLSSGRFITAIAFGVIRVLHISDVISYTASFILATFCTGLSIYKLYKIFNKDINSTFISMLASILIIINVFSIELYLYIEKGIMWLSVLFTVFAFEKMVSYFKYKDKKSIIFIIGYMLLSNFSYQGTAALFVTLSLLYILKFSKTVKEFIINNIVTAFCYGLPAIVNYVIVKYAFLNTRIVGEYNILITFTKIAEGIKNMFFTYSILPKYLLILTIVALIIIILYYILKDKSKNKALCVLSIIYILLGIILTTIMPQFMQTTNSIWFVPRSSYAFGSIIGILIAYLFINYKVSVKIEKILIASLIFYLLVQLVCFQTIIRDHYIMNYIDEYQAQQIKEKIKKYEENTGNIVTNISFYQKDNMMWSYEGLKSLGDINIKAMYPEWSRIPYLKYYTDRDFKKVENSEEIYNKYFKNQDWKNFSEDQIVIQEDTIHLFIY